METSLHRALKSLYAGDTAQTEVVLDKYRIDAISGGQLIEIQHGSLAAIRDKIRRLVESLGGQPIVVLGDFNCPPGSMPYWVLTREHENGTAFSDTQSRAAAGSNGGTFHGFTGQPRGGRIDWILVNRRFQPVETNIDRRSRDGRYPSDHFPVTATLRLSSAGSAPG